MARKLVGPRFGTRAALPAFRLAEKDLSAFGVGRVADLSATGAGVAVDLGRFGGNRSSSSDDAASASGGAKGSLGTARAPCGSDGVGAGGSVSRRSPPPVPWALSGAAENG